MFKFFDIAFLASVILGQDWYHVSLAFPPFE